MIKTLTACCALCQLSGLNNETKFDDLMQELLHLSAESRNKDFKVGDDSGKGQTSVFVITTPNEKQLRKTLKAAGFKKVHSFKRRQGYPEGKLKMYITNL